MLLSVFLLLSVAAALGGSGLLGGYDGFAWLWQIPVLFVGSFLLLCVILFGVLLLITAFIDPDKERQKDSKWFRLFIMQVIHLILTVLPVRVHMQGREKLPKDGRFLLVSNHIDNIDPAIFFYSFPHAQLAFVGKKETTGMFLIRKVMPKLLCPNINRENDREALKTIIKCIGLLKEDTVSIGIFPEGRINPYRKLAHFRPGVFKIAQKANVPIVVCTLRGSNTVIPNLLKLKSSQVHMHLLDVIQPEQFAGKTTVDIAEEVYAMMAADLGPENVLTAEKENT